MNTLYVRCQTKDYILYIVAARAGMRINKDNSEVITLHTSLSMRCGTLPTDCLPCTDGR